VATFESCWKVGVRGSALVTCRVMNGPLESIARELKFEGDTIMEGFVVSIFIVGAFLGSVGGGVLADKLGRRRTFQLDAIPLVLGAALRYSCISVDMLENLLSELM
jgi:MFS family permease